MSNSCRLLLEEVDFNNYYDLHRKKRELISYLNAYDTYKRFLMLKLPPPSDVKDKLDRLVSYNISIPDVHEGINIISKRMKELKKRS